MPVILKNVTSSRERIKKMYIVLLLFGFIVMVFVFSNLSESNTNEIHVTREKVPVSKQDFIFVITPTYTRPIQKAELTRLSHTLRLVPNVHWIIVEDATAQTKLVADLLKSSGLPCTHLFQPTPTSWKAKTNEDRWTKPRGVLQRNMALAWLALNLPQRDYGVIYFADDDNTYSLELFEEMRKTVKVSIWPVGLVGGLYVEKPVVEKGRVVGFNSQWRPDRAFPVDMAGFAVSVKHFLRNDMVRFSLTSVGGFQESDFLSKLTTREDVEPLADDCTKVLVWHTRSEKPNLVYEEKLRRKGKKPSNDGMEV